MSRSLDAIFRPRSVAVVGASRKRTSIGRQVLENLLTSGFEGKVFPVNPCVDVVHSMKCFPRVSAIPDPVDLAVLAVPRDEVLPAVRDCGRKGVQGLVVITAGFKETGEPGSRLEDRLLRIVREHGMRMIGPNCMGVMNTAPDVRLNASFATTFPDAGTVAFLSHSGALGEVVIDRIRERGVGISLFASLGNRCDVRASQILEYLEDDPATQQILMYLEGFGRSRNFAKVARRVARAKPIITVKSGRTAAGARAASSHTGSIVGMDVATESLFEQCGVLRANTTEEMLALAQAFANQPLPRGDRVAIVTNAGGPGILATDACVQLGLRLASFESSTLRRLRQVVPPEASIRNPIDTTASGKPEDFGATLSVVRRDPNVDSILVLFVSPVMIDGFEVARNITRALKGWNRPVMSCFMGKHRAKEGIAELRRHRIPVFAFPEEAARALEAMTQYTAYRKRPPGEFLSFEVDRGRAARVFRRAKRERRSALLDEEVDEVLVAYGFPLAPARYVRSAAEAIEFATEVGYPIVLKASSRNLLHKTEAGGVRLDIRNGDETAVTYRELRERFRRKDPRVRIKAQKMILGGKEVIFGVTRDPEFGHLLLFGLGGIYVEVIQDVAVRIHPITDVDAEEMIRATKGFPLLEGVRGEPPVDRALLQQVLLRLSQLVEDFEEIREMDINPFIAAPRGALSALVDARILVDA